MFFSFSAGRCHFGRDGQIEAQPAETMSSRASRKFLQEILLGRFVTQFLRFLLKMLKTHFET